MKVIRNFVCAFAGLVLMLSLAPLVGAADSELGPKFTTHMFGRDEVPPVASPGVGWSTWQVDGDEMHYRVIVSRLESGVVGIHLHQGQEGRNGPVVAPLDLSDMSRVEGSTAFAYQGTITPNDFMADLEGRGMAALVGAIEHDSIYVNVHTAGVPSGAIRGQLASADSTNSPIDTTTTIPTTTTTTTGTAPTTTRPIQDPAPLPSLGDGRCVGTRAPRIEFNNLVNAELTISLRPTPESTPIQHRIAANGTSALSLAPGTYTVEANVDRPDVVGFQGTWITEVGCVYNSIFYLGSQ